MMMMMGWESTRMGFALCVGSQLTLMMTMESRTQRVVQPAYKNPPTFTNQHYLLYKNIIIVGVEVLLWLCTRSECMNQARWMDSKLMVLCVCGVVLSFNRRKSSTPYVCIICMAYSTGPSLMKVPFQIQIIERVIVIWDNFENQYFHKSEWLYNSQSINWEQPLFYLIKE